jgi:hypothetical protein
VQLLFAYPNWNVNSKEDLCKELDTLNLTDEKKEEIENHQQKLFFEELRIQFMLRCLVSIPYFKEIK